MKKFMMVIMSALALCIALAASAYADEGIKIVINGEEIVSDVAPMTMPVYVEGKHSGDRVMVPIRAISEKLNFDVAWNQETKGITIYRDNNIYCMWVEKGTAFHLGGLRFEKGYTMDVTPTVIKSRTLVPVRAVAEVLGAEVEWQGETKTVAIKYDLGELENNAGLAEKLTAYEKVLFEGYDIFKSYADGSIETVDGKFVLENGKEIKFQLYPQLAYYTVTKFVALAEAGAYNGTIFHRVIKDFMAQGGGFMSDGNYIQTENIPGEFLYNGYFNIIGHDRGVLSYARADDPNSGSSQFFIVHKDSPHLDGYYAAFGKVTEGIEVIDEICSVQTDENDKPIEDIVIKEVIIEDSEPTED